MFSSKSYDGLLSCQGSLVPIFLRMGDTTGRPCRGFEELSFPDAYQEESIQLDLPGGHEIPHGHSRYGHTQGLVLIDYPVLPTNHESKLVVLSG